MAKLSIKELEEEMDEIRMLMKIWNNFYKILTTTFYDADVDTKALDPEFQQIKQIIAEHHGHFMKVIKKDFHIGQSVLTTVKRTITLEGFLNLSPLEINKTLIEWHDANILLNETLGSLESDRDKINRGREEKVKKDKTQKSDSWLNAGMLKNVAMLIIVIAIFGSLYVYGDVIRGTAYYRNYFAGMIDPILENVGIPPIDEVVAKQQEQQKQ